MLIPKQNTKQIYQYLMSEGVIVIKKDVNAPKHDELPIPNLQVMKTLQSLKSRGYVTEQFSWHHFYYFLTDEGILFLRQYLHLPETVVPATLTKPQGRAGTRRGGAEHGGEEGEERRPRREGARPRTGGDSSEYRRGAWRQGEAQKATA